MADGGAQQILDNNRQNQLENLAVETGFIGKELLFHLSNPPLSLERAPVGGTLLLLYNKSGKDV